MRQSTKRTLTLTYTSFVHLADDGVAARISEELMHSGSPLLLWPSPNALCDQVENADEIISSSGSPVLLSAAVFVGWSLLPLGLTIAHCRRINPVARCRRRTPSFSPPEVVPLRPPPGADVVPSFSSWGRCRPIVLVFDLSV